MVCPNCRKPQPDGTVECANCGVFFAKFHARPPRRRKVQVEQSSNGPGMVGLGILILVLLAWAWTHPGDVFERSRPLTPGGEPPPAPATPDETPEQALSRHLREVPAEAVHELQLLLVPDWLERDQMGVDQVRAVLVLTSGEHTVSSTGRYDYVWRIGEGRPVTGHGGLQALAFRRGKLEGVGRDVIYREFLIIDVPLEKFEGQTLEVDVTFAERFRTTASLGLLK